MEKVKYLFVDFDGTVRETISDPQPGKPNDRRPPIAVEEVVIIPGVKEKLQEWIEKGWFIVGVSNQSGVEKGYITAERVEEVAAATMEKLGLYFPFHFAPHKRTGTPEQLSLRKPDIGMAKEAFEDWGEPDMEDSFMVGDYVSDKEFANNLGIKFVDIWDFICDEN